MIYIKPIQVCDALCGSGKTSAFINLMNAATDHKFIFVTQFLSEVERIRAACASRSFVEPAAGANGLRKIDSIKTLLRRGENIATTHSLFLGADQEVKDSIRNGKYILVLDETVDICTPLDLSDSDLNILRRGGALSVNGDLVDWTDSEYDLSDRLGRFRVEAVLAQSHNIVHYNDQYFFWIIPPELFEYFEQVYVLTYMFRDSALRCFFDLYGLKYEHIGVRVNPETKQYEVCSVELSDRKRDLTGLLHVIDDSKLNDLGGGRTSLSFSWFTRGSPEQNAARLNKLKRTVHNVFRNVFKTSANDFMWTVYKEAYDSVKSKGICSSFVVYNKRASNEYAGRHYLAYCVNNFPRPWEVQFFKDHGVELNSDCYALSIVIQWIFRSAIRRGEEVWVYIPSARMRWLLKTWVENLKSGDDLLPLEYKAAHRGVKGLEQKYYDKKTRT